MSKEMSNNGFREVSRKPVRIKEHHLSPLTTKVIKEPDLPDSLQLRPVDQSLRPGSFNNVMLLEDSSGNRFVKRTLQEWRLDKQESDHILDIIKEEEFTLMGFVGNGGSFRFRSLREQAEVMTKAASLGLSVPAPTYIDDNTLLVPYIPGNMLETHLKQGETTHIKLVLDDVAAAHKQNIIYGDRWAANIIVGEKETIGHIDFDFLLEGEHAAEVEIAQLLYSIAGDLPHVESAVKPVKEFFQDHHSQYDWERVRRFMKGEDSYLLKYSNEFRARLGGKLEVITSIIQ